MKKLREIAIRWLGGIPAPDGGIVNRNPPAADTRKPTAPASRQKLFNMVSDTIGQHQLAIHGRDEDGRIKVMAEDVLDVLGAIIGACVKQYPGDKTEPLQLAIASICKQCDMKPEELGLPPLPQAEERPARLH